MRPLRLPSWIRQPPGGDWLQHTDLLPIVKKSKETPVLHGLVHGDLQQSNMLVSGERFYVIDWGDHFHVRPPLYDLLFYLFKHSRSLTAARVAEAAFAEPQWIEDGLPGALEPAAIQASLVAFTLMLTRRYQFRRLRRRQALVRQLQSFIYEVGRRLLPSVEPYVQLPNVLLDLPDFQSEVA